MGRVLSQLCSCALLIGTLHSSSDSALAFSNIVPMHSSAAPTQDSMQSLSKWQATLDMNLEEFIRFGIHMLTRWAVPTTGTFLNIFNTTYAHIFGGLFSLLCKLAVLVLGWVDGLLLFFCRLFSKLGLIFCLFYLQNNQCKPSPEKKTLQALSREFNAAGEMVNSRLRDKGKRILEGKDSGSRILGTVCYRHRWFLSYT